MDQTLLLNATYEPLMIIHWQRAVALCYLGKSEVLEEYNDTLRTSSGSIQVPSVMRLCKRVRALKPTIRFSRQNVYARDQHRCQYCGVRFRASDLTYDHVLPRSKGGPTSWSNIVACCVPCNRRKANRSPAQVGMKLLKKPVKPSTLPYRSGFNHRDTPPSWKFYLGITA